MSVSLQNLLEICGRPAYVKAAAEQPHQEKLGYDSREEAYLSWVRVVGGEGDSQIQTKLAEAGKFWGIWSDMEQAQAKWAEANQTRDPIDEDFALVQDYHGRRIRKFAAYDQESTVRAAEAFFDHRFKYPYEWRKQASVRILKKAQDFQTQLPEYLNQYLHKAAGFGYPTKESIHKAAAQRMNAPAKHEELTAKLASVLTMIADSPVLRFNDELVKTALAVMDQFDYRTGLSNRYGKVELPEEMIQLTEPDLQKMATEKVARVTLVNGYELEPASLDKELLAAVDPALAKMAQDDLVATLPTLPKPDADLLVRLLA